MLSHETHRCLSQWTAFSSGRFCRLLKWLLEFHDLRCLPLSNAGNWTTGVASIGCTNASLLRASGYFLPEMYHPIFTWYKVVATIVSRLLVQDGHKVEWGFAIFLGKSCPETESDRCPKWSPRIYRVQMPKFLSIGEQCYGPQILPYFRKLLSSLM